MLCDEMQRPRLAWLLLQATSQFLLLSKAVLAQPDWPMYVLCPVDLQLADADDVSLALITPEVRPQQELCTLSLYRRLLTKA